MLGEEIKNAAEVVKTTVDAIKAVEETGTGKFVGRVFGGMLENSLGLVGDAIKFKRIEFYERHVHKTKENLKRRGIDWERDDLKTVKPKVAIAVFENASFEEDDDLHTLWSNLLANAMDPNFTGDIALRHVSILKEMEPLDLRVLQVCYLGKVNNHSNDDFDNVLFSKANLIQDLKISDTEIEVAILNLMRLGCVKGGMIVNDAFILNDTPNSIYLGTSKFTVSLLGVELCKAALTQ